MFSMPQKQKRKKYITKKIREHRIFLFKLTSFCISLMAIGFGTFSAALLFRGGWDDLTELPAVIGTLLAITAMFVILIGRIKNRGEIHIVWVAWPILVTLFCASVALMIFIHSAYKGLADDGLSDGYEPLIAGTYECAITDEDVDAGILNYSFKLGKTGDFSLADHSVGDKSFGKYAIVNRRSDKAGIYYELRVIIGENSSLDSLDSTRYELGSLGSGQFEIQDLENSIKYRCVKK